MPRPSRDDCLVLDLGQLRHDERLELAGRGLHLFDPTFVELRPVSVVVAAARCEQIRTPSERLRVGNRVHADVHVAVEHSVLGAERGRHDEEAGVRLVGRGERVVAPDDVEGVDGLGAVQRVLEPEALLVERAAIVAEHGRGRRTSPPIPRIPEGSGPRTGSGSFSDRGSACPTPSLRSAPMCSGASTSARCPACPARGSRSGRARP